MKGYKMEHLRELEQLLIERIKNLKQSGKGTKLEWGQLIAYEDILDEVQAKLGTGILDQRKEQND